MAAFVENREPTQCRDRADESAMMNREDIRLRVKGVGGNPVPGALISVLIENQSTTLLNTRQRYATRSPAYLINQFVELIRGNQVVPGF